MFIGHLQLPPLHLMLQTVPSILRAPNLMERMRRASPIDKLRIATDSIIGGLGSVWYRFTGYFNFGLAAQDYSQFEQGILRALKSRKRRHSAIGQYSFLALFVAGMHPRGLDRLLAYLPTMPGATGPLSAAVQGLPMPRKLLSSVRSATSSNSGSDHEGGEDMMSSRHTVTSDESISGGSGGGLDASWVGVEAGN